MTRAKTKKRKEKVYSNKDFKSNDGGRQHGIFYILFHLTTPPTLRQKKREIIVTLFSV